MSDRTSELVGNVMLLSSAMATGDDSQMREAMAEVMRREVACELEEDRRIMLYVYLQHRDDRERRGRLYHQLKARGKA